MTNTSQFVVAGMKFTGITMYSFRISNVGGSVEITTKMLSIQSPKEALEECGYDVYASYFEKGDILFQYYPSLDGTMNINIWKGEIIDSYIRNVPFINVLIITGCVILAAPNYKVTIHVD